MNNEIVVTNDGRYADEAEQFGAWLRAAGNVVIVATTASEVRRAEARDCREATDEEWTAYCHS